MAKVAKVKKREISSRSRAARRGESPPPGLAPVKSSAIETEYKPWLHTAQNAGISKKKGKQMTRQQKVRQRKGAEKAERDQERLEKKVSNSKQRAKKVQARRQDWTELNEKLMATKEAGLKVEVLQKLVSVDEEEKEATKSSTDAEEVELSISTGDASVETGTLAKPVEEIEIDEVL